MRAEEARRMQRKKDDTNGERQVGTGRPDDAVVVLELSTEVRGIASGDSLFRATWSRAGGRPRGGPTANGEGRRGGTRRGLETVGHE